MEERINEIKNAIGVLKKGGVILYPTDTIWGIGCDATKAEVVERIFGIKGRSDSKSLIILASDMDMVARYVKEIPEMAETLIEVNDSPMTIIYPQGIGLADNVLAEDGSVAIRIPQCSFCVEMIRRFGRPIVSTSANISGEPSPRKFEAVSDRIKEKMDFCVNPEFDTESTGKASSIIQLGLHNEVKVIRE